MGRKGAKKKVYLRIHELKDAATPKGYFPTQQTKYHQCEEEEVYGKCGENADIAVKCILNQTFASRPMPARSDRAWEHV